MRGQSEKHSRRRRRFGWLVVVLAGCCLPAASPLLHAQPDQPAERSAGAAAESDSQATPETIAAWIKEAEESKDLDADTKTKVIGAYRQMLDELKRIADFSTSAEDFETRADSAEMRLGQIRAEIAELPDRPDAEDFQRTPLAELEQQLGQQEAHVAKLQQDLARREAEPARRVGRRKDLRTFLAAAPQQLAEIAAQLKVPPPAGEAPLLTAARRRYLTHRRLSLEQEAESHQNELTLYDSEDALDLVRARRDLLNNQIKLAEAGLAALRQSVNSRRQREAQTRLRDARIKASQADPALQSIATQNREWAEQAQSLSERIAQTSRELELARSRLEDLSRQFTRTRQRVGTVGLTGAVGQLLRKERADLTSLADVGTLRRRIGARQEAMRDAQFTFFRLDDERSELHNLDAVVERVVSRVGPGVKPDRREELKETARELLGTQREILDALIRNYNNYFDDLVSLDTVERQTIRQTESYAAFIDERVLWIQSAGGVGRGDFVALAEGVAWFLSLPSWSRLLEALWNDALERPVVTVLAVLLFVAWASLLSHLRGQLKLAGAEAEKRTCQRLRPTLTALGLTLCLSAFWPALLGYVSWRIASLPDTTSFGGGVAFGLGITAAVCFPVQFLRQSCRSKGLAASHFNWPPSSLQLCRRYLRLFLLVGLPLVFVSATMEAQGQETLHLSLGRLAFILLQLLVAYFFHRLMRPVGGMLNEFIEYNRGGWVDRFRYIWHPLPVMLPLSLALLAALGYFYTAHVLATRLLVTVSVVLTILFVRSILLRWVIVNRRKLRFAEVRQRVAEATGELEGGVPSPMPVEDDTVADLSVIGEQTSRLLNTGALAVALTGIWFVWVGVFPALRILDQVELWTTTVAAPAQPAAPADADPESPATSAAAATGARPLNLGIQVITLSDLARSILFVVLAIFVARNLPGLLEISLLRHLPLDGPSRFAITTLSSYAIVLVGGIMAFMAIGIGWSKVQWLAAALTLGIGFGLQEIVANFVSGLIILVERPIRVGDIVTVGDVSGVVTRIRIRATTITNWERKEFIVPNKDFITGRLLNWTLTDAVNRVLVEVGVAYGSDTELARELLLKVARDHPLVLDEPPPVASFEAFGDSTLNFVLRTYLPSLEGRLAAIHELHTAVDRTFREHGIEIAFPQRDLHMRSGWPDPARSAAHSAQGNGKPGDQSHEQETPQTEGDEVAQVSSTDASGGGSGNDSHRS